jgi:hypothetical protein
MIHLLIISHFSPGGNREFNARKKSGLSMQAADFLLKYDSSLKKASW